MAILKLITNKNKGFTLIEILVALTILAIVMTTSMVTSIEISGNSLYLEDKTIASWVGSNIINEARVGTIGFASSSQISGVEVMLDRQWQWTIIRTPTANQYIDRLDVDVGLIGKKPLMHMVGFIRTE